MNLFAKSNSDNKHIDFQYGKSSKLCSDYSLHFISKGHSRKDLSKVLRNFGRDLIISDLHPDDSFVRGLKVDIPFLICPECKIPTTNSTTFVQHIILHHLTPSEREICSKLRGSGIILPVHANKLLNEGLSNQTQQSYILKKFENTNKILQCSVLSPLASFLSLTPLKIYLDSQPVGKGPWQHKNVTMKMGVDGKIHTVCFSYTWVERYQVRLSNDAKKKQKKRDLAKMATKCVRHTVDEDDIFFKKNRTEEEDRCLAKALGITEYTKDNLNEQLEKFIVKAPVVAKEEPMTYKTKADSTGRAMTRDERRLISTLSDNLMLPPGAKRLRSSKK